MKNIVEEMYQTDYVDDDDDDNDNKEVPLKEESYITTRRNVALIAVGNSKVAVPTVAHIQEMVNDIADSNRKIKQLQAENRKLHTTVNKLVTELNKMKSAMDNKMDKF